MKTFRLFVFLFAIFLCAKMDAQKECDVNHDGKIDISDVVSVINFMAGNQPSESFSILGLTLDMVNVQGGTFMMGTDSPQYLGQDLHRVTVSNFLIGKEEVTQDLWEAIMGSNPSYKQSQYSYHFPVEQVSWYDCQEFISKLNNITGLHFRLPTEAEWEYAARGGNRSKGYIYSGGDDLFEVGWFGYNSDRMSHISTLKSPNELGIYGMSGNVWEWCQDWYEQDYYKSSPSKDPQGPSSGTYKVCRGGSWDDDYKFCQPSYRSRRAPDYKANVLGLRLALSGNCPHDVNADGRVDISDVVAIINMMSKSGTYTYDKAVAEGLCPDANHPHAIDLGIGVKFACCNVGAISPLDFGDYYYWGYCNGKQYYPETKEDDIAGTDYDIATSEWGSQWCLPSMDQLEKLTRCEIKGPYVIKGVEMWEHPSIKEIWGYKYTGPNGKSIFLPCAGLATNGFITDYEDINSKGYYYSSHGATTSNHYFFANLYINISNNTDEVVFSELKSRDSRKTECYSVRPVFR
ncbi:MAG: SUMF1/EgtB/PvdO family nonheme iron enzyme [Bacteroidaceae bacterium]|nr:SUMF1/EgtB/PvdO family nonheme iron enzyme [Bacteroidaceae bacterium]